MGTADGGSAALALQASSEIEGQQEAADARGSRQTIYILDNHWGNAVAGVDDECSRRIVLQNGNNA